MNARLFLLLTLAALTVAGCGGQSGGGGPPAGYASRVKAVQVSVQPVEEKISLVASISANESIDVKSEIEGTIAQVNFEEGQPVEEGQLLIRLDTRKWDASVAEAEAEFKLAEANRNRAEAMMKNQTISLQEYDQAMATYEARKASLDLMKQQLKDARILARFSGITGARRVSPGQVIGKDTLLTSLIDIEPVKVEFQVPERFLGQLRVGQSIAFRVPAYPGEEFRGVVYFIDPQVDLTTRTVLVKARQDNKDGRLRPGMFGNLDLILTVREQALVVPESAILRDGDAVILYTIGPEGTALMVPVELGARMPGLVEIVKGLSGGEMVIYEGTQKIGPGAPVVNTLAESAPEAAPAP
jgi:membrane fusion protein (multidrug efflux system)